MKYGTISVKVLRAADKRPAGEAGICAAESHGSGIVTEE